MAEHGRRGGEVLESRSERTGQIAGVVSGIEVQPDVPGRTGQREDLAPAGEKTDEGGWADLGQGIVDWSACAAALQGQGVSTFVLEHDKPADLDRFIGTSVAAFGKYFKGDNT